MISKSVAAENCGFFGKPSCHSILIGCGGAQTTTFCCPSDVRKATHSLNRTGSRLLRTYGANRSLFQNGVSGVFVRRQRETRSRRSEEL